MIKAFVLCEDIVTEREHAAGLRMKPAMSQTASFGAIGQLFPTLAARHEVAPGLAEVIGGGPVHMPEVIGAHDGCVVMKAFFPTMQARG